MNVAILLSAYNGGKFLKDQLDSILNQTYKDWVLYIRDDGSTDDSLEIIDNYIKKDSRIKLLNDDVKHRGCKNSFLWLLKSVSADYYFFSDQDDVWLEDKILQSLTVLESMPHNQPCLIATDLQLVDCNLNTITSSMWDSNHIARLVKVPQNIQIAPLFTGCTMAFNSATKTVTLQNLNNSHLPEILHDQLVALSVYKSNGYIKAIPNATILYRQHGKNVIGAYTGQNIVGAKFRLLKKTLRQNLSYYKIVHKMLGTSPYIFIKLKLKHLFTY